MNTPVLQPRRPNTRAARSTRRALRVGAALFAAFTPLFLAGCKKGADANAYAAPPPPEVVVVRPVEREVIKYLTYTGTVEASETVDLRARVQGFLEEVKFKPGQRVTKGDILFVIDPRAYKAAVDQARANVKAQEAALQGAENDARLARELAEQNAGPQIDAIIKTARRDAIAAELAGARAQLAEAELNLEYTVITAPMNGRITRHFVDPGNLVGRGEPTLLATIVQATPAYVSVDVSEADVLEVRRERERERAAKASETEPGQIAPGEWRPTELSLADETEFKIKGRVDYVEPSLNAQTGTLRVRTRYENTDEVLAAGLFANIRFPMSKRHAMLVPEAALLSDQQGRFAMVVNEKDEVEVRRVQIGILERDMRVVEEGLSPTDRVIVLGMLKARPGSKVTPKMQEPAAPGR